MSYILRTDRYGVKVAELAAAGVAHLPAWAAGPADFWSAVDGFERANGRLCLELELGLPRELPRDRQVAAVGDYIDRLTAEAGPFPITWAIHDSGDGNPHVHLMLQERALSPIDRSGPKAHFKRADTKRPERGGVEKSRWWHSKERVFWSRALWADACNQQLLAAGYGARFDPRRKSVRLDEALRTGDLRAAAALCTQTERHEGVAVAAARRRVDQGLVDLDDLPEGVAQVIRSNDDARAYNCWLRDWSRTASDKELRLFLADHLRDLSQRLEAESPSGHVAARAAWLEQQHTQALAEDAERRRYTSQYLAYVRAGQDAGWLDDDEAEAHLYRLIDPHTLEWLREATAELGDLHAEHSYRQWLAEQRALDATPPATPAQSTEPDPLADPATLIWPDAADSLSDPEPQWLIDDRGDHTLGWWSDDPDTQWRYDPDADDWVEYDPDHRPTSGPRLG
jgi:hypothetical protein